MAELVVGQIDLNDTDTVADLMAALRDLAGRPALYHRIQTKNGWYFEFRDRQLPLDSGWYILLAGKVPVYVGRAQVLDNRLNSDNGSLDNFAKRGRSNDPARNFVKRFRDMRIFAPLRTWIVVEQKLCGRLGASSPLEDLDRANIEKLINLNRGFLQFV